MLIEVTWQQVDTRRAIVSVPDGATNGKTTDAAEHRARLGQGQRGELLGSTLLSVQWAEQDGTRAGQRVVSARASCGARAWPYTEHNICVLDAGHDAATLHKDGLGRTFDAAGYSPARAPKTGEG